MTNDPPRITDVPAPEPGRLLNEYDVVMTGSVPVGAGSVNTGGAVSKAKFTCPSLTPPFARVITCAGGTPGG